jgi:lipopolysaccharide transport system permease protein
MDKTQSAPLELTLIRPGRTWSAGRFREVWQYRELLYFLVWRDVKVRYKQTFIGAGWAVAQPLLLMAVFTIFLGQLAHLQSDGVPYPLFAFAALIPWTLFSQALGAASNSLVNSTGLISKVYFPRLLLPLAASASYLLDMAIASAVLVVMMALYRVAPTARVILVPFLALLAFLAAVGIGTWLAAVNVRYRDVRYAVPFLIQFWLFATPVAYALSIVPVQWRTLYALNPMVGVVEGFRWALLGTGDSPVVLVAVSTVVCLTVLAAALMYFHRVERSFADII